MSQSTQEFWGVVAEDGTRLNPGAGEWASIKTDTGKYKLTASPVGHFGSVVVLTSPYGDGSSTDNVFSVADVTILEDGSVSFTVLSSDVGTSKKDWYYQDGSFSFHLLHTIAS